MISQLMTAVPLLWNSILQSTRQPLSRRPGSLLPSRSMPMTLNCLSIVGTSIYTQPRGQYNVPFSVVQGLVGNVDKMSKKVTKCCEILSLLFFCRKHVYIYDIRYFCTWVMCQLCVACYNSWPVTFLFDIYFEIQQKIFHLHIRKKN